MPGFLKGGKYMNRDCFAYADDNNRGKCLALNLVLCDNGYCPFYKTNKQIVDDYYKALDRVNEKHLRVTIETLVNPEDVYTWEEDEL